MNEDFSRVLQKQMDYFNGSPREDALGRVQEQISEVKDVAMKNIERVLQRGDKIELLVDKTDRMKNTAHKFHKTSKRLKNTMWWQNVKMWLMIILIVAVVVFLYPCFVGAYHFHSASLSQMGVVVGGTIKLPCTVLAIVATCFVDETTSIVWGEATSVSSS